LLTKAVTVKKLIVERVYKYLHHNKCSLDHGMRKYYMDIGINTKYFPFNINK